MEVYFPSVLKWMLATVHDCGTAVSGLDNFSSHSRKLTLQSVQYLLSIF